MIATDNLLVDYQWTVRDSPAERRLSHFACDGLQRTDPTGTLPFRRQYSAKVKAKANMFREGLRQYVIVQEQLGLATKSGMFAAVSSPEQRIISFQNYVDRALSLTVLDREAEYLDGLVSDCYAKAVVRAFRLIGFSVQVPNMVDHINGIRRALYVELQGVVEATSQQLVRAASAAILHKSAPALAFRDMVNTITKTLIGRADLVIEDYASKSHVSGTLDVFEHAGVTKVGLIPEMKLFNAPVPKKIGDAKKPRTKAQRQAALSSFTKVQGFFQSKLVSVETAGDYRVCPECESIAADGPYKLAVAKKLIPAHPRCRCALVPYDVPTPQGAEAKKPTSKPKPVDPFASVWNQGGIIPEGFGLEERIPLTGNEAVFGAPRRRR